MTFLIRLIWIASMLTAVFANVGWNRDSETLAATPALNYLFGSNQVTGGRNLALRVELTAPAPAGGVRIRLASTSLLVAVPGSVLVPEGKTDTAFTVPTGAVQSAQDVTIQAELNGKVKARTVAILPPALKELSVQSRMRARGSGKVTILLSAPAPQGGMLVNLSSNRPSLLTLPSPIVIPPGKTSLSVTAPVGWVSRDTEVSIIARLGGQKLVSPTLIRNYDIPTASPTLIATTPVASNTSTPVPTEPDNQTQTSTMIVPTQTIPASPSATSGTSTTTATPSAAWTSTLGPDPVLQLEALDGQVSAVKGATISFTVCLDRTPGQQRFVSFRSSDEVISLTTSISPPQWIIPAGTTGPSLCMLVSMVGRSDSGDNVGLGQVNLIANLGGEDYISPPVTFVNPTPTPSGTLMPTSTYTSIPVMTETATQTLVPPTSTSSATEPPLATPTNTIASLSTSTSTQSPTETATVPLPTSTTMSVVVSIEIPTNQTEYQRGSSVLFAICISISPQSNFFVSFRSSEERVALSDAIEPPSWTFPGGSTADDLCKVVVLHGSTGPGPQNGLGMVNLVVNAYGTDTYSTAVTFVPIAETPTGFPATVTPTIAETSTGTPTSVPPTESSTASATSAPPTSEPSTETPPATQTWTPAPSDTATALPVETPTGTPTQSPTPLVPTSSPTPSETPALNPDPVRIELIEINLEFIRGSSVSFDVCIEPWVDAVGFVSARSGNPLVVPDANIVPGSGVIPVGECLTFVATGRVGFGGEGLGPFYLIVNLDGIDYQGPTIHFVME